MTLPRRLLLLVAAALMAVMMTAAPAVAAEPGEKCDEALHERQRASDEKEFFKAQEDVVKHCAER